MNCPRCGIVIHLDKQSKEIDKALGVLQWGKTPEGFFRCKGCGLLRPEPWWDILQLDIDTKIKFVEEEKAIEEVPEELSGTKEAPWGD
jgi:uncharacterized C2H2 Zn-finger protein